MAGGSPQLNASLLTPGGFAKLSAELQLLRSRRDALGDATTVSAEHLDVPEELVRLDRQIAVLEERLRSATVVEANPADGELGVGERARIRDLDSGELIDYRIVGVGEADPTTGNISYTSPVGSALLGRRVGDVCEVQVPRGLLRLEVLEIRP